MAEDFGVEGRGSFYDRTGAIRDVVQNHLLQVLTNVAMEPPPGAEPELVRSPRHSLAPHVVCLAGGVATPSRGAGQPELEQVTVTGSRIPENASTLFTLVLARACRPRATGTRFHRQGAAATSGRAAGEQGQNSLRLLNLDPPGDWLRMPAGSIAWATGFGGASVRRSGRSRTV